MHMIGMQFIMALKGHTDKDTQGWLHCTDTSCEFTLVQPIVQTATASCLRGERPSDCMVITVFTPEDYKSNARAQFAVPFHQVEVTIRKHHLS